MADAKNQNGWIFMKMSTFYLFNVAEFEFGFRI